MAAGFIRRDSSHGVAGIEQAVEIGPEQESVSNLVRSVLRIGPDVGRFQGRKGMLFWDCTSPHR